MKPVLSKKNLAICSIVAIALVAIVVLLLRPPTKNSDGAAPTLSVVGLFPMTGPGASLGEYLRNGVDLAKEEIDQRFEGRVKVDVEIIDSKNQPREAITALQSSLASRRPNAIICAMSSVSKAIVPIVEEKGITTIVTTTALTDLPKGTRNVVRVYPTSEDFVEPVAQEMLKRFQRLAVLYIHDDFGDSNQRILVKMLKAAGKELTTAEPYELTRTDFRPLIAKVLSTSPEAVFVTGYGPAFIAIIKQLREANADLPLYTEIGFANPAVLAALGDDADGIVFDGTDLELSDAATEAGGRFRSRYRERFGSEPYQVAGFARDALVLLAEAAFRDGRSQTPDKPALIGLSPFQGVMGSIRFDSEGESRVNLRPMTREKGRTILLTQ